MNNISFNRARDFLKFCWISTKKLPKDYKWSKETLNSGKDQFWITHRNKIPNNKENTDIGALTRGAVSLTPIGPRFLVEDYSKELIAWLSSFK